MKTSSPQYISSQNAYDHKDKTNLEGYIDKNRATKNR